LREPVSSLNRADGVVITRCDQITENELSELEEKLRRIKPDMVIVRSIHAPVYVKYPESPVIPAKAGIQKNSETMDSCLRRNDSIEQLKGKKIFAFCGIGNPGSFLTTIKAAGAEIAGSKIFNDHHHYTDDCIADIIEQAERLKADLILTTEKDWTKVISDFRFQISDKSRPPVAYIGIEIKFSAGEDKLRDLIDKTLAGKMPKM
jgi:tetraacyldisaccharide 4'-kinase